MPTRKRPRPYTLGLRAPIVDEVTRRGWAERLRAARIARGFTQSELAALVPCSRGTVSNWERGTIAPTSDQRKALARALKRRESALFPASVAA